MIKIYHNPRCRKSREGLKYLQERVSDIQIIEYLREGISGNDLKEIILKLNVSPRDLLRKNESLYKKELKNLDLNEDEWLKVIAENPVLLRRPIVISRHKGVIGDPAGEIEKIL